MGKRGPKPKVKTEPVVTSSPEAVTQETAPEPVVAPVVPPALPVSAPKERDLSKFKEKPPASHADRIAESRKALEHPLQPGQVYFEAPDGMVIVGESERGHAWYREGNGGKGCWINPRR